MRTRMSPSSTAPTANTITTAASPTGVSVILSSSLTPRRRSTILHPRAPQGAPRSVLFLFLIRAANPQGVQYLRLALSEATNNVSKVAAQEAAGARAGPAGGARGMLANEAAAAAAWMQGTYENVMGQVGGVLWARWGMVWIMGKMEGHWGGVDAGHLQDIMGTVGGVGCGVKQTRWHENQLNMGQAETERAGCCGLASGLLVQVHAIVTWLLSANEAAPFRLTVSGREGRARARSPRKGGRRDGGGRGAGRRAAVVAAYGVNFKRQCLHCSQIYVDRDFQPELLRAYRIMIGYVPPAPPPRPGNAVSTG